MYRKNQIESVSLQVIQEKNIVFLNDIFPFVPFSRGLFYQRKCNELDSLKKAIENNRIRIKNELLQNWIESENPVLQLAAYKLIGTPDEVNRLTSVKTSIQLEGRKKDRMTPIRDDEPIFIN
jgi:hypothetical protein